MLRVYNFTPEEPITCIVPSFGDVQEICFGWCKDGETRCELVEPTLHCVELCWVVVGF